MLITRVFLRGRALGAAGKLQVRADRQGHRVEPCGCRFPDCWEEREAGDAIEGLSHRNSLGYFSESCRCPVFSVQ